jgi:proto-oncogene C-crk
VSHYIINKIQQSDQTRFRIGDQFFPDVPSLLSFYQRHYLDTTHLMRPVARRTERVRGTYDFVSNDSDDLPFRRGEVLTILSKDEDQWWTAKNSLGQTGSIPVNYVEAYDEENGAGNHANGRQNGSPVSPPRQVESSNPAPPSQHNHVPHVKPSEPIKYNTPNIQRRLPKLPAMALVKQARVPNAYDKTALKLQIGDRIKVTQTNINGQWEGELNGKVGHFPFTHVDFIELENGDQEDLAA